MLYISIFENFLKMSHSNKITLAGRAQFNVGLLKRCVSKNMYICIVGSNYVHYN